MAIAQHLRSPKEQPLFVLSCVFSALGWAALMVTVVGLLYALVIGLALLVAHALFLAHVHGDGLRLSERQLPDVYARVRAASAALGLPRTPEVYVLQGGGVLDAFAMKLLSRRFVVLLSDLVEGCQDVRQLDFVVGHELAHHAAGHLAWRVFLLPSRLVPLLGPAYQRACEYTCDRAGASISGDTEQAMRALVMLAAGGRLSAAANLEAFAAQAAQAGGFWMAVRELASSHPFLCKRVAAVQEFVTPGSTRVAPRNPFAYPLAPLLAGAGAGAGMGNVLVIVAVVGILAAIAVPNLVRHRQLAREAEAASSVEELGEADRKHAEEQELERLREAAEHLPPAPPGPAEEPGSASGEAPEPAPEPER